jgi:hypothetical protein
MQLCSTLEEENWYNYAFKHRIIRNLKCGVILNPLSLMGWAIVITDNVPGRRQFYTLS